MDLPKHMKYSQRIAFGIVFGAALTATFAGCREPEKAYLVDAPRNVEMPITNTYDATIYPDDQLYIYVGSRTPEAVKDFNEETNRTTASMRTSGNRSLQGYLVSQSGDIIFPVLGRLHVEGLTYDQLRREIEGRLIQGRYVKDPVVTVELLNFHVTIIGEVKVPQMIHFQGNRLTIFEALAQCGDVTMDGLRDNVLLLRQKGNTTLVDTLDLTSKDILNSPYYYLQQNDIIYVEPTPKKRRKAWRDEDWPQYISIGSSALRMAYVAVYRVIRSNNR